MTDRNESQQRRRDLTRGPVAYHLARMTLPMIVGLIAVLSISVADTYFVGQLGIDELAALSFTFPVVFSIASVGIGLGAGASSVVSRAVGAGDERRVRRLATDSLILAFLVVAILSVVGWLTIAPLFRLMGAEPAQMTHILAYMRVWYPGAVLLVVTMASNNILRATGDAISPSVIMVVGAVVNILLDPVLIFGLGPIPAMGVEGAAWATLAARLGPVAAALYLLHYRDRVLAFSIPPLEELRECWRSLVAVALPAALGNLVTPVGFGILTAIVARFGADVVAGFGVATRIESLAMVPIFALSAVLGPIAGQNWGARQVARIRQALHQGYASAAVWSVVLAAGLALGGAAVVALFNPSPAIVEPSALYPSIVPISLAGYGVLVCTAATFNAVGRAGRSLALQVTRTLVLGAPLAWLGAATVGFVGVPLAIAAANFVAAGLSVLLARRTLARR